MGLGKVPSDTADAETELRPGDVIEINLRPEGVDIAAQ
jgi:hypothetical protein